MENNLKKNIFSSVTSQVVVLVTSLIAQTILIRCVGSELVGANNSILNILTILTMFDFGVGGVLLYYLHKPIIENNDEDVYSYIKHFKKLYTKITLFIFFIGIVLIPLSLRLVNSNIDNTRITILYLLNLVYTLSTYLFAYKSVYLDSKLKKYVSNTIIIVYQLLKTIVQVLLLLKFSSYELYLLTQVLFNVLTNITISVYVDKHEPLKLGTKELDGIRKNEIKQKMLSIFVYKIGSLLLNNSESIIISMICGSLVLGRYIGYTTISVSLVSLISALNLSIISKIGKVIAIDEQKQSEKTFEICITAYQWLITFFTCCLYMCFNDFIKIWLGEEYLFPSHTVLLTCLKFYFFNITHPCWIFVESAGMYNKTRNMMLFSSILSIILSILLGYKNGIDGIILGMIVGRLITLFWYEPYIVYIDILKIGLKKYWLLQSKYIIIFVGCLIICNIISIHLGASFISMVIKCFVAMFLILAIYILLNIKKLQNISRSSKMD